ncbi:MAG: hypothetical protein DCC71_25710, partial [Proteobacteria bacterium]
HVAALAARTEVERVALDAELRAPAPAAAPDGAPAEWNLEAIGAPQAWQLGADGAGSVVATLDTGADALHPDLAGGFRGGAFDWFDPFGQRASPYDASGHGTEVLSVAVGGAHGGTAIGAAPGALWIAARIYDDSGAGTLGAIHQAFQWALDPDGDPQSDDAPDVLNGSFGLAGTLDECDDELAPDVAALRAAEVALVFAAGNFGPGDRTSVSPANDPASVAVGASDTAGAVAPFSGRGPSACEDALYPSLVAPGVAVRVATLTFGGLFPNSYATREGTSVAAPHVAGAFALLRSAHPQASLAALEAALAWGALDVGEPGPDHASGHGALDVMGALARLEDFDGDGVVGIGIDDVCPWHAGPPERAGCPMPASGCGLGAELLVALAALRARRRAVRGAR